MAESSTIKTFQSNIKNYNENDFIKNYSLFLGAVDTSHEALHAYDPLKNGRGRIFFMRMPVFMGILLPDHTKRIRHMMEYGFTKVDGIGDLTLETEQMTGGYVGKQVTLPSLAKDDTNQITIGMYEFAGSPIREYMDMWISGISDQETGYSTYHGLCDPDLYKSRGMSDAEKPLKYAQYNHTAEAIYVTTDPTGLSDGIEYACLLTNMFPTSSPRSHFNYNSGESSLVQVDVPFACNKYESPQINEIAKSLLNRFKVLKSSLNFNSNYTQSDVDKKFRPYINAWGDKSTNPEVGQESVEEMNKAWDSESFIPTEYL